MGSSMLTVAGGALQGSSTTPFSASTLTTTQLTIAKVGRPSFALHNRDTSDATIDTLFTFDSTVNANIRNWGMFQNIMNYGDFAFIPSTERGGDARAGSAALYMDYQGSVGIGTTDLGAFKLNVNGDTNVTGSLSATGVVGVGSAGGLGRLDINSSGGDFSDLSFSTASTARWIIEKSGTESGSNVGGNLNFYRYTDAGSYLGNPLTINRDTGLVAANSGLAVTGAISATGRLSTSAAATAIATPTKVSDWANPIIMGNLAENGSSNFYSFSSAGGVSAGIAGGREAVGWNTYLAFYTNNITAGANVDTVQETMRLTSSGILDLPFGQIKFPAVQAASDNVNTLDDYEEGTFTPTIAGMATAGGAAYAVASGSYTKVGRAVSFQVYLAWSAHTGTGNMRVAGLPFASSSAASTYTSFAVGHVENIALTAGNTLIALLDPGTSASTLRQTPTGGGASALVPIDVAGEIMISGTYFV